MACVSSSRCVGYNVGLAVRFVCVGGVRVRAVLVRRFGQNFIYTFYIVLFLGLLALYFLLIYLQR